METFVTLQKSLQSLLKNINLFKKKYLTPNFGMVV